MKFLWRYLCMCIAAAVAGQFTRLRFLIAQKRKCLTISLRLPLSSLR